MTPDDLLVVLIVCGSALGFLWYACTFFKSDGQEGAYLAILLWLGVLGLALLVTFAVKIERDRHQPTYVPVSTKQLEKTL